MKVKELIRELEYLDCNDATLVQCSNFDETDDFGNISCIYLLKNKEIKK